MSPAYIRIAGPTSEPVTAAEFKGHARIDSNSDLAVLSQKIRAARAYVEEQTGRALLTQTWRLICSDWPAADACGFSRLFLEKTPLASVQSVKYYPADGGAQATLSTSVYNVVVCGDERPGYIELVDGQSWPDLAARSDAVEINFTAGTTSASLIHPSIIEAIQLIAAGSYAMREDGITGTIYTEVPAAQRLITSQKVGGFVA